MAVTAFWREILLRGNENSHDVSRGCDSFFIVPPNHFGG
jgi:hypothetical protein